VAIAATCVTALLYVRDSSKPHANSSLAVLALIATAGCVIYVWQARNTWKRERRIEKAGRAAVSARY
jgi:hypothetical protein